MATNLSIYNLLDKDMPAKVGASFDPMAAQERQLKLKDLVSQQDYRGAQIAELKRKSERERNLATLLQNSNGDLSKAAPELLKGGYVNEYGDAMKYQQQQQIFQQNQQKFEQTHKEQQRQVLDRSARMFYASPTREGARQAIMYASQNGIDNKTVQAMMAEIDRTPDEALPAMAKKLMAVTEEAGKVMAARAFPDTSKPPAVHNFIDGEMQETRVWNSESGKFEPTGTPGPRFSKQVAPIVHVGGDGTGDKRPKRQYNADMGGWVEEPSKEFPEGRFTPTPGVSGKIAQKEQKAGERRIAMAKTANDKVSGLLNFVDTAIGQTGMLSTGIPGKLTGWIPSSPAYDLNETVKTIKANVGFRELQDMRLESPTGGALGQVAVQELNFLQATLGSLEVGQGREQLLNNLKNIKEHYTKFRDAMAKLIESEEEFVLSSKSKGAIKQSVGKTTAASGSNPVKITSDAEYDALPSKTKFIGPDGKIREKP